MRGLLLLTAALAACGGSPPKPAPPPPATLPTSQPVAWPTPPPIPTLRLPTDARPRHYRLELDIDPGAETFTGAVDIDIEFTAPTQHLWLHGEALTISAATLSTGAQVKVVPGDKEHIGFSFDRPVGPGTARLHIEHAGKIDPLETEGIFRQRDGDDWYAYTQFESTSARRAFPCFDEPSFKATWQVVLNVPRGMIAASNYPLAAESDGPSGRRTFTFAPTKPLSSYLVAFAVGPFDIADGGKSKSGTPVRIFAPRGKAEEVKWALPITVSILDTVEDYFGIPYPFGKLDEVVIPQTVGFGAMENPGLITYASYYLLAKPGDVSLWQLRSYTETGAHEIAHMWFGDLVTLAWWNDTWLNESFASWMASKVVGIVQPKWAEPAERVLSRSRALSADAYASARAIRQPVARAQDIGEAFDRLTYSKGEAILEMIEHYLGEETFRKGVQAYVGKHAWGNATGADFLAALDQPAPDKHAAAALATFLDQPGAPLLAFEVRCAGGRGAVWLTQQLYQRARVETPARLWHLPVCVRHDKGETCTLLETPTAQIDLAECPAWVFPNAGGRGYFRTGWTRDTVKSLPVAKLTVEERLALISDITALVEDAVFPADAALQFLLPLLTTDDRHTVEAGVKLLTHIRDHFVPVEQRPRFAALVRDHYGAAARELGLLNRPGESEETRSIRDDLVPFVAVIGQDPVLSSTARTLALKWLDDRSSLDADSVARVLEVAAAHGNPALYDKVRAAHRAEKNLRDRARLTVTLFNFGDPKLLRRSFELILDPEVDVREIMTALRHFYEHDEDAHKNAYEFIRLNYDKVIARFPEESRKYAIVLAAGACTENAVADFEANFHSRAAKLPGSERTYAKAREEIAHCVATKAVQTPGVRAFLKRK